MTFLSIIVITMNELKTSREIGLWFACYYVLENKNTKIAKLITFSKTCIVLIRFFYENDLVHELFIRRHALMGFAIFLRCRIKYSTLNR